MDPDSFVEHVEAERATELGRLGSGKLLIALTDADLDAETVVRTAASRAAAARDALADWAADESDDRAARSFDAAAESQELVVEGLVAEGLAGELAEFEPDSAASTPATDRLRELGTTVERAGGLLGWALVADREYGQYVSFFINEAATETTREFRSRREEIREIRDDAADLLGEVCESDDDWSRAGEAAESVIRAAYDDYVDTLSGMGLDPKPVC